MNLSSVYLRRSGCLYMYTLLTLKLLLGQQATPLISICKLKLADPVATHIHLTHEYLARSNNNRYQGTEIFVSNLILHGGTHNVRLKLLADSSFNPITDRA